MLLSLLPDSFYLIVIVLAALGLILRIITPGALFSIILTIILMALIGPFFGAFFEVLPGWVSVLVVGVFLVALVQWVVRLLFGGPVAANFIALLLHDLVLIPFRLIGLLFRRR